MEDLLSLAQAELKRGKVDNKHPFRFCWLATLGKYPEIRTVVNRGLSVDWTLSVYTDSRSPKVEQIRQQPAVSVLFYHPKKQLQLRAYGEAQLPAPGSAPYEEHLARCSQGPSLRDYTTEQAPGSPLAAPLTFTEELHFQLIQLPIIEIDVLLLNREGHRRSRYRQVMGSWQAQALVP